MSTKRYTIENKPHFNYGDMVKIDMLVATGNDDLGIVDGKIVGKGVTHVLDFWLVDFDKIYFDYYPYKVMSIIHTAIIEE